jgi:hypothetical protein
VGMKCSNSSGEQESSVGVFTLILTLIFSLWKKDDQQWMFKGTNKVIVKHDLVEQIGFVLLVFNDFLPFQYFLYFNVSLVYFIDIYQTFMGLWSNL